MGWKTSNKRIKYKLLNIKLYCSTKWSRPQLISGWENSINRRHPSLLHITTTEQHKWSPQFLAECSYTAAQRSSHTLQKKTIFRVSIFENNFHIFLFFLHCTLISELLSLDEGCWLFSHLGFPGEKYFCYSFALLSIF